jgi:hypothetical protein
MWRPELAARVPSSKNAVIMRDDGTSARSVCQPYQRVADDGTGGSPALAEAFAVIASARVRSDEKSFRFRV